MVQLIISLVTAIALVLVAVLGRRKLEIIHVLVNSRLAESLDKIVGLEAKVAHLEQMLEEEKRKELNGD